MLAVFCADVGSVKNGRFGWCGQKDDGGDMQGSLPSELVASVVAELKQGNAVCLGFECPLFVPVPFEEQRLGAARTGEGNRAWSAGAGAGSLATGLVQTAWVLRGILTGFPSVEFTLDATAFRASPRGVLIWEAFVSGLGGTGDHIADAKLAVAEFSRRFESGHLDSDVTCEPALSLVAAAVMFADGKFVEGLDPQCLVVRVGAR